MILDIKIDFFYNLNLIMDYTKNEKKTILTHQKRLELQKEKEKQIDDDIKDYENKISQLKRKKASCKGHITKNKKIISSIVNKKFFETCPEDIMSIILNKLYNPYDIHDFKKTMISILYSTSNKFRRIILETFNVIKISYNTYSAHQNSNVNMIIHKTSYKNIFIQSCQNKLGCPGKKFEDKILEQLLYIPHKPYGRSLIHLFVRNNKLDIMKYLVSKFNNLNINVPTEVDGWLPIHNALWFNNNLIKFLTNLGIKDDWNFSNGTNCNFDDIYHYIGWLKIYKKQTGISLLNLDDFKQNIENNKHKIDLQTKIDYKYLINYEQDLVNILAQVYNYLDNNIKNIISFEIL